VLTGGIYYRSSEGALELLLKLKHVETTDAIHEQLMSKFSAIMQQFMKEIQDVETEFNVRITRRCCRYLTPFSSSSAKAHGRTNVYGLDVGTGHCRGDRWEMW
jgi:hypothetical protein